ncbi:ABC transporter permease [Dactylosporangium sp. CA-092794]|uniref:ABC transporter permease n=1 Tax=Dactylosporangium sp. CA-092794 TaxID=3239929 RepID=UPI003D92ED82
MTATAAETPPKIGERRTSFAARLQPSRFSVIGVWAVLALFYALLVPDLFPTSGTFRAIFGSQQALVFLCMALICTFVVGEFDLSFASNLGLAATVVPVLVVLHGQNIWVACIVAVLAATAVGAANGWIVVFLGIDPIVTTLGMGTLVLGLALKIENLTAVSGLSPDFAKLSTYPVLGLPISFYYGVVLTIALAYVLAVTPLGRNMRFVGANPEVARLAGINVRRIRFGAFVASGLICGVGGVLLASAVGGYDASQSQLYLLPAFSATFLGTAVIQPGRFNPIGSWVAIYFLVTGIVGLQLLGYVGWISQVFYGAALVLSVTVSTLVRRRARRP